MARFVQEEELQPYEQSLLKLLLLVQVVSLLYFGAASLTSTLHSDFNFSAPHFTALCVYTAMSLFLFPVYIRRKKQTNNSSSGEYASSFLSFIPIHGNWKAYMLMGVTDYAGLVTTIGALKYTSLASYTLIWSTITPFTMLFSKCFLIRRYTYRHYMGVFLCVVSIATYVSSEEYGGRANTENGEEWSDVYPNKTKGNIFALLGAAIYGLIDVLCEYSLENYVGGTAEYLGVTGFFAATISLFPALIWDREQMFSLVTDTADRSSNVALVFSLLVVSQVGSYYYSCLFLEYSESTLLNLSTKLTENLLAVLFSIFFQNTVLAPPFYISLTLMFISVGLYQTSESPILHFYFQQTRKDNTHTMVSLEKQKIGELDEDSSTTIVNDIA